MPILQLFGVNSQHRSMLACVSVRLLATRCEHSVIVRAIVDLIAFEWLAKSPFKLGNISDNEISRLDSMNCPIDVLAFECRATHRGIDL